MEPPVRPYNPNGPGGARPNVANPTKRSQEADAHDHLAAPQLATQAAPSVAARVPRAPRASVAGVVSQPVAPPDVAPTAPAPGAKRTAKGQPRGVRRTTQGKAKRGAVKGTDGAKTEQQEPQSESGEYAERAQASGADLVVAPPSGPLAPVDAVDSLEVVEATPEEGVGGAVIGVADFEDIFTRFQTPLTNFVFRLVGNREQAYDLTQDVFVKAYRALSGGTTIQAAALSSWLYRIASNTATDALRRRRLISWLPLSLFNEDRWVGAGMPGMETPGLQQGQGEETLASATSAFASGYDGSRFEQRVADREIVQRVLGRLPEKYRQCLLFYEYEGFSCAEIADMLSVSPSAVKMRLMRARERFITLYQEEVNG